MTSTSTFYNELSYVRRKQSTTSREQLSVDFFWQNFSKIFFKQTFLPEPESFLTLPCVSIKEEKLLICPKNLISDRRKPSLLLNLAGVFAIVHHGCCTSVVILEKALGHKH